MVLHCLVAMFELTTGEVLGLTYAHSCLLILFALLTQLLLYKELS